VSDDVRSNAELTEATASGLRWITLARIGTEVLLMASMVVLARLIPPSAFGMFAIAVIVQEIAVNVPSEAVGSALVQRRSIDRAHLQGGLALSLAIGAAFALATAALALVVVRPVFGAGTADLVLLTTPWFLIGAVLAVPIAQLRRRLDFRLLSVLELVQSTIRSVSSIVLAAAFGLDAPSLVLGGFIGMGAMLLLALAFAPVPLPRWRRAAVRDLLAYGGPASLATVAWTGFRNADYAIVGARLGAAQAGFYWRGFQLAVEYQRKITSVMTQMGFPVLARTQSFDEMLVLRHRMVRILTIAIFPILVCLVVLAPVVVPWLFGDEWAPAVLPTQILAAAGAATVVIDQVGAVLMATGRTRALLGYGVAHFAVYAVAVFFAASSGIAAVAIAAASVHGVFLVIAYDLMLRGHPANPLRVLWDDVKAALVPCTLMAGAAVAVDMSLTAAGWAALPHMAAVGAVSAIVYLTAMRLWFPDGWNDLAALTRRVLPVERMRALVRRRPAPAAKLSRS
jgi:O-antigen/teichoic acid export membrane protein